MEDIKTVNELVNSVMTELLENTTNKIALLHRLKVMMIDKNDLTMDIVVKRSYNLKSQNRLNEIKKEIYSTVTNETDDKGKPKFSNESKRSIETDIRLSGNKEVIYLDKQLEVNKDEIVDQELIINNLRKLIEITMSLVKTL